MAKKSSKVRKSVPAMYQSPPEVKLPGVHKITSVDIKTRTIHIESDGPVPLELTALIEIERHRLDLAERIEGYTQSCLERMLPHFGERPDDISVEDWENLERRLRLLRMMPQCAPAEARDAFLALKTLNRMTDELVAAGDYPDAIDRALCWAIDLGQLLQRSQTQIDHGEHVHAGRMNTASR